MLSKITGAARLQTAVALRRRGVVVNALVSINEVVIRPARSILGWGGGGVECLRAGKPSRYVTNHL